MATKLELGMQNKYFPVPGFVFNVFLFLTGLSADYRKFKATRTSDCSIDWKVWWLL